jgi:hypothetical protein
VLARLAFRLDDMVCAPRAVVAPSRCVAECSSETSNQSYTAGTECSADASETERERNRLRFVLKVMDPLYAIRYVINLVVRFGGHVVGGHTVEAWIIAWAWMSCLREVPVIWRERRHLTTQSRLSNRSLYKLWSDSGCLVQRTSEASDVVHYA